MNVPCPNCTQTLAIQEGLEGRRVRCPTCQEIFVVPQSTNVATAPLEAPAPWEDPAPRQPRAPEAVRQTPREDHFDFARDEPHPDRYSSPQPREDRDGVVYVAIERDRVRFENELRTTLREYIATEQLDLVVSDFDGGPPNQLRPRDVVIQGAVTNAAYGSQFVRYFVPILPLLGVGACKLAIDLDVEDGSGRRKRVVSSVMQHMGFLGGNSETMMSSNVTALSHRTAAAVARMLTGKWFLNRTAYQFALSSLVLGILSVIPFIGVLLGVIGLVLGLIGFTTINARGLPRRKGLAICGIIFSLIGLVVTFTLTAAIILAK